MNYEDVDWHSSQSVQLYTDHLHHTKMMHFIVPVAGFMYTFALGTLFIILFC